MHGPHNHFLPPSLQPPSNKPILPVLAISILEARYLQILPATKPTMMRYKWWGLKNVQFQHHLDEQPHRFFITVSQQMFVRYCMDMKVLEFELCDRVGKGLAKGYLNFSMAPGWGGEDCEFVCDLKSCKNMMKIGEIKLKLSISDGENPLCNSIPRSHFLGDQKYQKIGQINQKNTNSFPDHKQVPTTPLVDIPNPSQHQPYQKTSTKFLNYNIQKSTNEDIIDKPNHYPDGREKLEGRPGLSAQTPTPARRSLNLPRPEDCICQSLRPDRFIVEKLRLKQEIDMFFNSAGTDSTYEQMNLEAVGWRPVSKSDETLSCKLSVPVLDNGSNVYSNQYTLGRGRGSISVGLDTKNHNEEQIKNYLINNSIQIRIGTYLGSVPLFKVVGSRGDIICVQVLDKNSKKQVLKGHYLLKLSVSKKPVIKAASKQAIVSNQKQQSSRKEESKDNYMWIYLGQLHFLEPINGEKCNMFAVVRQDQGELRTKTIWRSESPTFNQIMVIKMPKEVLVVEFWNRISTDRLVGKARIDLGQIQQYGMEVPIKGRQGRLEAYIKLCIGKGDITAATRFLNLHARPFCQPTTLLLAPAEPHSQALNSSEEKPRVPDQPSGQEKFDSSQLNQNDQSCSSVEKGSHKLEEQEQVLDLAEIHNKIFTRYIGKECDWMSTYRNRNASLAQFMQLLNPIYSGSRNRNVTKLASVYLDIQTNSVKLDELEYSLQSFQVYYDIHCRERDQAMAKALQSLNQEGITINQLETKLLTIPHKANQSDIIWRLLKQQFQPNLLERLRYYYELLSAEQLCDCFRKFEVYQTTKGEQIEIDILKRQVYTEITDILHFDHSNSSLKQAIKQAGLDLSKFQLLCLFGEISPQKPQNKMMKSPTFGFLATDRMPKPLILQQNSSLAFNLGKQSLLDFQEKFGNPKVSPINQNAHKKKKVRIGFKGLDKFVEQIYVNGNNYQLGRVIGEESIEIDLDKNFNFEGYVQARGKVILQFEGPIGQWIGLIDEVGRYSGCVIFQ